MTHFDLDPSDPGYPGTLRAKRTELKLTQAAFAQQAGYSPVMQGRYETERDKSNSAIPSQRTAAAIRKVIAGGDSTYANAAARRTLKAVTVHEMEQAIASAIQNLVGGHAEVIVKDVVWTAGSATKAAVSFDVAIAPDGPEA